MVSTLLKKAKKNHFKLFKLLKVPSMKLKRKLMKSRRISSILLVMKPLKSKRNLMPSMSESMNSKQNLKQIYLTTMMIV